MCGADWNRCRSGCFVDGSPPRVRSRHPVAGECGRPAGITSACAEQTTRRPSCRSWAEDHLRVCGADGECVAVLDEMPGSPPRVRSRLDFSHVQVPSFGITSACAEQTHAYGRAACRRRDHLRVCGADLSVSFSFWSVLGSPPRVRSRLMGAGLARLPHGITSACAEQTMTTRKSWVCSRDHLRVCGADSPWKPIKEVIVGSPPRVRSRRHRGRGKPRLPGITSACAEQTSRSAMLITSPPDHLRVCGADLFSWVLLFKTSGSPPRVRSRLRRGWRYIHRSGITSACAEQTWRAWRSHPVWEDHLRVCGADSNSLLHTLSCLGSPPRVRSRHGEHLVWSSRFGITSACAEQTQRRSPEDTRWWDHLRVCGADSPRLYV